MATQTLNIFMDVLIKGGKDNEILTMEENDMRDNKKDGQFIYSIDTEKEKPNKNIRIPTYITDRIHKQSNFKSVSIISESQSAFISGRQILNGILVANEIVDEAKKKKKLVIMFKVDFEKAYDSVD